MNFEAFKHKLKIYLESHGNQVMEGGPHSSFPCDMVAFKGGDVKLYKCKPHGKINRPDLQKLLALQGLLKCPIFIVKEVPDRRLNIFKLDEYARYRKNGS